MRPDQLGVLLVDEPHTRAQERTVIEYAETIHAAQPRVMIWEDPTWPDPSRATRRMFEVCDVISPNLSMWLSGGPAFARFYLDQRDAGRRLWLYSSAGPASACSTPTPTIACKVVRLEARGGGLTWFWAFTDAGDGVVERVRHAAGRLHAAFVDRASVTTGKHMEAVREGVEDYVHLHMLRGPRDGPGEEGGRRGRPRRGSPPARHRRRSRHGGHLGQRGLVARSGRDRSVADTVRVEILDALVSLSSCDELAGPCRPLGMG